MKDNLKWILIAGAVGFLFFKDQIVSWVEGVTGTTPAPAASPDAGAAIETTPPPAPPALDTTSAKARLLAAASKDPWYTDGHGAMSLYRWNYYYQQVRGVPGPDPTTLGFDSGDTLLTIDEYWLAMNSHGLGRAPAARRISAAGRAWRYAR